MARRVRKKVVTLRQQMEVKGVGLRLFEQAGWFEGYTLHCGTKVDALECRDGPDDVADILESYDITEFNWSLLGISYVYW